MSANNIIYINRDTFEVFYQPCADNMGYGNKVSKGKDLDEAVDIAQRIIDECEGQVEYGIWFVRNKKS